MTSPSGKKRFLLGCGIIVVLLIGAVGVRIAQEIYVQTVHAPALNRDLGFKHGSPYVRINGSEMEVLTLEGIVPGGRFEKAGVQSGDIPLGEGSIAGFYRMLEGSRGQQLEFQVVSGEDGPPLEQRPIRTIQVHVPQ